MFADRVLATVGFKLERQCSDVCGQDIIYCRFQAGEAFSDVCGQDTTVTAMAVCGHQQQKEPGQCVAYNGTSTCTAHPHGLGSILNPVHRLF
jgi:hypothetical protein